MSNEEEVEMRGSLPASNARGLQVLFGIGLIAISILLHAPLEIAVLLVLMIVLYLFKIPHARSLANVTWIIFALNILALVLFRHELQRPDFGGENGYWKRYGPLALLTLAEVGQLEAEVSARRRIIYNGGKGRSNSNLKRNDFTKIDPFTGESYRDSPEGKYSIGPDVQDDGVKIIYDPTNGMFSAGDILFEEAGSSW